MPLIWKVIPLGGELVRCNINGGPIGHWSWSFILLCGTIAYDLVATRNMRKIVTGCLAWGLCLCLVALALYYPWGGYKSTWLFSKYHMTASYSMWATGLCFLTLLLFYLICDVARLRIPHLTVLGKNALLIYILQVLMLAPFELLKPEHPSWTVVWIGFFAFYAICYGTAYTLHRKGIYVKL